MPKEAGTTGTMRISSNTLLPELCAQIMEASIGEGKRFASEDALFHAAAEALTTLRASHYEKVTYDEYKDRDVATRISLAPLFADCDPTFIKEIKQRGLTEMQVVFLMGILGIHNADCTALLDNAHKYFAQKVGQAFKSGKDFSYAGQTPETRQLLERVHEAARPFWHETHRNAVLLKNLSGNPPPQVETILPLPPEELPAKGQGLIQLVSTAHANRDADPQRWKRVLASRIAILNALIKELAPTRKALCTDIAGCIPPERRELEPGEEVTESMLVNRLQGSFRGVFDGGKNLPFSRYASEVAAFICQKCESPECSAAFNDFLSAQAPRQNAAAMRQASPEGRAAAPKT